MATVGTWLKRVGIVTGVGLGGTAIFLAMPNREKSPIRHPSVFNWVNLGADKMYYYCGASMRKFVDPETGHEQAIKLAGYPRAVRGVLGFLPVQFDYANLKTAPFERQQRENAAAAAGNGGILGSTSGSPFPISSSSPSSSSTPPLKSLYFHSPIGLAAGFDKNAEAIDGLLDMGFGFVEIGSVTPLPQPGNPKPRVFRLEADRAIINRYGFNSHGADAVRENLEDRRRKVRDFNPDGIVGVNLGKNKTSEDAVRDYQIGVEKLSPYADYLVVNVSSPNTPGLRALQQRRELEELMREVKSTRDRLFTAWKKPVPPLLVKIAPDLSEIDKDNIAAVAMSTGLDGIIISNTTVARDPRLRSPEQVEVGGLSGAPLKHVSTELIREMYRRTQGKIVIVGVGGVENGVDAYAKIRAGASLVQLYSSFAYQGPHVLHVIKRDLCQLVKRDGFETIEQAIGADHKTGEKWTYKP